MKVRRFFYTRPPGGSVLHIQRTRYHGADKLACGRVSAAGWLWSSPRWQSRKIPVCKQCECAQ